jgi:actin-related protein
MVAKPLAICAMAGMDTCVVVDSGALSTSVAVILNGQVALERWKHIPVGGWHVAENLKQAMQWRPEEYTEVGHEQALTAC